MKNDMERQNFNKGEIVLDWMYNGDYLTNNLGHEIINLYKSDNGCHYIYLQQIGVFHPKHAGRVQAVLLVRTVPGKRMLEVLGKAEGITDVYKNGDGGKQQKEYIRQHNVTYGGVPLDMLFEDNDKQQDICITFKAEKVLRPKKTCYISYSADNAGENVYVLTQHNQAKTALRQYIDGTTPDDFRILQQLLNNTELWGLEVTKVDSEKINYHTFNFFDLCGIADSELAFSNALAYFMRKYPQWVVEFARHINQHSTLSEHFQVERETEANIDLYITDDNNVIVLENKIKSQINGLKVNSTSIEKNKSQLDKYYRHAQKNRGHRDVSCYLLAPNYNDINLDKYVSDDCHCEKIFYKQIYDFIKTKDYEHDFYLKEFVAAIEKHTHLYDNELYDKMKERFVQALRLKKQTNKLSNY